MIIIHFSRFNSSCFYQGNASNTSSARTQWCSSSLTAGPYDDFGYCVPEGSQECPKGFSQASSPPSCLYSSLPSSFFNCFSCVINGHSWMTNFSSDPFSLPNIGVCLPPSAVANLSLSCPMCGSASIYQELYQCPANQLASCAACTYANFVWCGSESRCANAIGSCIDRQSGITSFSRCVTPSSVRSLPTCSSCLQQNGPLQPVQQVSQWCSKRVCCGSNITGRTSIYSSTFVFRGTFSHDFIPYIYIYIHVYI